MAARLGDAKMTYPIGTEYLSSGELVRTGYVCEHEFLGQMIRELDVNQVTVARGIWRLEESKP
jgi:hypothetical protein